MSRNESTPTPPLPKEEQAMTATARNTNRIETARSLIKDTALGLIPGFSQRAKILETLGLTAVHDGIPVVRPSLQRPGAVAAVEAEIERLLLAGDEIPNDIGVPILEAEKVDAALNVRAAAIDSVVRHQVSTDELFSERAIGAALNYLRVELARVIDTAKSHASSLGNATTSAGVIEAGPATINAWRELGSLAEEYNEIRSVQRDLQRAQKSSLITFTDARFEATALFANALDIHPHWVDRRIEAGLVSSANEPRTIAYREWLGSARRSPAFDKGLEPAYRLALIATTTTPWIPSPSAFEEAYGLANHASSQARPDVVASMEDARLKYFTLTGADHNHEAAEGVKPYGIGMKAFLLSKNRD